MKKERKEPSPRALSIKRQYASCFVTLFASFLIGLAVGIIMDIPIGLILTESSVSADNIRDIASGITGLIGALITIFILSYTDGYRNSKFVFKQLLWGIVLTFITQAVITFAIGHSVWFSGPTNFLARYVFETRHFEMIGTMGAKKILESYRWFFMVVAFWTLYAPSMILGKYLGSKKGKKDSEKAKEEKLKEKVLDGHPFD